MGFPVADAEGRVVFRRLLPGRHMLSISMPGIGWAELETEIRPGENELEVTLSRPGG